MHNDSWPLQLQALRRDYDKTATVGVSAIVARQCSMMGFCDSTQRVNNAALSTVHAKPSHRDAGSKQDSTDSKLRDSLAP